MTESMEYLAETVIFAAPSFTAQHIIEGAPAATGFVYSPWLTANLTLDRWPRGEGYAWDNVLFDSPSLGYVVATHQSLAVHQRRTVWTYYWALADQPPQLWRRALLERDWGFWERGHPERSGARASGYSGLCVAPGCDAAGARDGAAGTGISEFAGAKTFPAGGVEPVLCQFRLERNFDLRRGAVSRCYGG